MPYATLKMLRMVLAPGQANPGSEPNETTGTAADMTDGELLDALAEADSVINTAIGGRYATPVDHDTDTPAPDPIQYWSRNLAAYLATCTYRGSLDFTDTDPVYRRYALTMAALTAVGKGDYTLNLPPASGPGQTSGAGDPINPNGGRLFDGSDLDLGPGYGTGWPYDGPGGNQPLVHPLLNPLEADVDTFEVLRRGMQGG